MTSRIHGRAAALTLMALFASPSAALADEPIALNTPEEAAPEDLPQAPESVEVGGFVDVEWRVMGLADHVSHGPAFAVGLTFFDGLLRVGVGGLGRPGPINPQTFNVTLPGGATYRDQTSVNLRSDGAMVGLHVALAFEMPGAPWLALSVPLTVGFGGFGYYLTGSDRQTPDGRRVSAWENELFNERDSFLGVVIDVGARAHIVLDGVPWMRPYVGVYYTVVPGFETLVRSGYDGVSASLGLEIGHGL